MTQKVYAKWPLVIRQLLERDVHESIVAFMENFVPFLPIRSDKNESDGPHKFNRRYAHNMAFFVDIHKQLKDYASEIFGLEVKPSYVFLSMYDKGGQCPLHIDRPQCRYTIDYLIRQETSDPWPIHVGPQMSDEERDAVPNGHPATKGEHTKIVANTKWFEANLFPNDAVCYSGTNAWHYRPTKSTGKTDLVFFHFVPEGFDGPLD